MKRILFNICSLLVVLWLTVGTAVPVACSTIFEEPELFLEEVVTVETTEVTVPEETEPPIESYFKDIQYIEQETKEHCLLEINTAKDYINYLQPLGDYPEVTVEIERVNKIIELYNQKIIELEEQAKWNIREGEYPVAIEMWYYLTDTMGLNNYVAAGIMGNLMVETGGSTLSIEWDVYSDGGGYYGLCQWSLYYNPSIGGSSFEEQCNYLNNSIEAEFTAFGFCYQNGFGYQDFLNLQNERDAALAFAKCYERCAATSINYSLRQSCAETAYSYFVG